MEGDLSDKNINIATLEKEISIFLKYQSLESCTRNEFAPILNNPSNFVEFVCFGLDKPTIDNIYDYISHRVLRDNFIDVEILQDILIFFIEIFNLKFNKIFFEIDQAEIGDLFNSTIQSKTAASKQTGTIDAVYLRGYNYNSPKLNTKKTSIVKVV